MHNQKVLMNTYPQYITEKFQPLMELTKLPNNLRVSTVTITCSFDTEFNLINIGKYINLSNDGILSVKYGNNPDNIRTLLIKKKKTKKSKKSKKMFYNQNTLLITSKSGKIINVKIFLNGSIQMTGCNDLNNCIDVLNTLCIECIKVKGILEDEKINEIHFATKPENLDISKVQNIQIRMINCNFKLGFKINRNKLYEILLSQNIECIFEPIVHACVNIKYNYKNTNKISIFVFESGSIIITGAKNKDHIIAAYQFITTKLFQTYNKIVISNLDEILKKPEIQYLINKSLTIH